MLQYLVAEIILFITYNYGDWRFYRKYISDPETKQYYDNQVVFDIGNDTLPYLGCKVRYVDDVSRIDRYDTSTLKAITCAIRLNNTNLDPKYYPYCTVVDFDTAMISREFTRLRKACFNKMPPKIVFPKTVESVDIIHCGETDLALLPSSLRKIKITIYYGEDPVDFSRFTRLESLYFPGAISVIPQTVTSFCGNMPPGYYPNIKEYETNEEIEDIIPPLVVSLRSQYYPPPRYCELPDVREVSCNTFGSQVGSLERYTHITVRCSVSGNARWDTLRDIEYLSIYCENHNYKLPERLNHLRELIVSCGDNNDGDVPLIPPQMYCPALTKIDISSNYYKYMDEIIVPELVELDIQVGRNNNIPSSMVFPKLETLNIHASYDVDMLDILVSNIDLPNLRSIIIVKWDSLVHEDEYAAHMFGGRPTKKMIERADDPDDDFSLIYYFLV
jgi:hypothetical protein